MNDQKYLTIDDYTEALVKNSGVDVHDFYDEDYDINLSVNIVKTRLECGLTQKELATALDTKQPNISRIEAGMVLPSHEMIKKIARKLGVRPISPSFSRINEPSTTIKFSYGENAQKNIPYSTVFSPQTLNNSIFLCPTK